MSEEDWERLERESEQVFHDLEGMTYEYKEVWVYLHPSGRHFQRYEYLHVDADTARVSRAWLEDPEGRLAELRAKVAAREAKGEQAFYDLSGGASAPSTPPAPSSEAGASPMSQDALSTALTALLQRSGGFVIVNEAGGRFVQFAGGVGEPLLLDVPNLSAEEGVRAATAFGGQPFSVSGNGFNLAYGQDASAAAAGAMTFFQKVFGVAAPQLSLVEE